MIYLISGATHTGKTNLAQKLLEKLHIPYMSQDHLKMGLYRSGYEDFNPISSIEHMTEVLWPITVGIIKTAIENKQQLIIEGCYIPFNYKEYFTEEYLAEIKYICIVFSKRYILENYDSIISHRSVIEERLYNDTTLETLLRENKYYEKGCRDKDLNYVVIEKSHDELYNKMRDYLILGIPLFLNCYIFPAISQICY